MCLILIAWQCQPTHPLLVAANRDEFFVRPTAPAAFWPDAPQILAGRDLEAGGSWLGITRGGRFAALTNFRDPAQQRPGAASRGLLVAGFLRSTQQPEDYLAAIDGRRYNGYNLLLGDGESLWWASNVSGERRLLPPGIYGLSNHLLDTPWPKVGAGKTALSRALAALPDEAPLFALLHDDRVHPDPLLPATGVPLEWERLLSAAFVKSDDYGTRSSTVITRRGDGWLTFDEQTWGPGARPGVRWRYRCPIRHDA
ncbi:MAG: hypothetical protein CVU17_05100 [Betaproteobacteria bacterium HGW-Betaproteobacteria-11]|nr:MAG: hypothetical protein CVU17_05100 [Betaproteobacteria bacterium HGW-Betaproteobacteria-11]